MSTQQIKRTSRIEFTNGGAKLLGMIYKVSGSNVQIMADDGQLFRGAVAGVKLSSESLPADHPSKRFGRGARVEFQNSSFEGWKAGEVTKIDAFGFMDVATDDGGSWKGVFSMKARASQAPAPKHAVKMPSSYAKGDRVEWKEEGKTFYGVVSKGGSGRIEVTQDGGVNILGGSVRLFQPSTHPLKTDAPDTMDRWTVVGYKPYERMSEETTCFDAKIALDGKSVITVSNRGTGGSNMYHPLSGAPAGICEQLEADAKAWRARASSGREPDDKYVEHSDLWVEWKTAKQPFGVTAADYWNDFDDIVAGSTAAPAM